MPLVDDACSASSSPAAAMTALIAPSKRETDKSMTTGGGNDFVDARQEQKQK